jgi:hypothetical protein
MIFAFATDDRTLMVFASEAEATSYAEGIDVEDGVWLFFDECGAPLQAIFTTPNKRGSFLVQSGIYHLKSVQGQNLAELLPQVSLVEGRSELNTISAVVERLASNTSVKRDGLSAAPYL